MGSRAKRGDGGRGHGKGACAVTSGMTLAALAMAQHAKAPTAEGGELVVCSLHQDIGARNPTRAKRLLNGRP